MAEGEETGPYKRDLADVSVEREQWIRAWLTRSETTDKLFPRSSMARDLVAMLDDTRAEVARAWERADIAEAKMRSLGMSDPQKDAEADPEVVYVAITAGRATNVTTHEPTAVEWATVGRLVTYAPLRHLEVERARSAKLVEFARAIVVRDPEDDSSWFDPWKLTAEDGREIAEQWESQWSDEGHAYASGYNEGFERGFRKGEDSMRERAAKECWSASDEITEREDMTSERGMAQTCATRIRALPAEPPWGEPSGSPPKEDAK